ncbi:transposase [Actinomadura namibiensis]|uniref:Transposase n=1 Tax=Actinomadura namibiensis TaxID=182080 RepID=A0A7W3LZZ7_ACTNM|nr:transposase [Actinomadura namibiensis]MBA8957468.1 transposase [Actinomadura namibiensis]
MADKGDSSRAIQAYLRRRGISATIPERVDQAAGRARRDSRGGRPPSFDPKVHKRRNVVERCFNQLKHWRGIATRYDETVASCQAAITLAAVLMWM